MSYVAFQYAEALFALANENNQIEDVVNAFEAFVDAQDEDIYKFLNHPKVANRDKKEVVGKAITNSLFKNFVFVLIDNFRIEYIDECLVEMKKIIDNQNRVMNVVVYSMKLLNEEAMEQLRANLSKKHNRIIKLENIVDKSIVGGLRIEYDGNVLDDTINNFLGSLKANLTR